MPTKKYIIVAVIMVVLWCGFMGYRHMKQKRETDVHREKEYKQVSETAKKSPRAGLAQVGMALKKYYEENNAYPPSLTKLYPEYLANKWLIEEIDWHYEPRGDNFFLSKTVIFRDKRIVASIDKGLRPQAETTVMVATPTLVPKPKEVIKPKELETQRPEPSEGEPTNEERLELARKEFLKALRQRQMHVTSVSLPERDEARIISTVQPEILSIVEAEIASGLESELSQRYLVWKDNNGVLGFSNVQYPDTDRLSIHAIGRWYNVKIPLPQDQEPIDTEIKTTKKGKDPEMIAASLKGLYLVWKDQQGTLGFGNVQYPGTEHVSAFQDDSWVGMERPPLAPETDVQVDHGLEKAKEHEKIASAFSTRYLIWKDEDGILGFGNVQYPETEHVSAFQDDSWVGMERPPLAPETDVQVDHGLEKAKEHEKIASAFSTQYLIWKDEDGILGFGNVQYPEMTEISHVHVNGSWEPVTD